MTGFLVVHVVLVLVALRLALVCAMQWRLLRIRRAVASSPASRWENLLLYALPVLALLMATAVFNSLIVIVSLLNSSAA